MSIFQKSVISKYLLGIDQTSVEESYEIFKDRFCNSEQIANIKKSKEEQYQEGFIRELFVDCLGYTINPTPDYNITTEFRNISNARKADGAIIYNNKTVAVIELKGWDTQDLREAESQAFGYKYNHKDSKYVIVSNFGTLRLYVETSDDYEDFQLFNMGITDFKKLYLVLSYKSITADLPLKLKEETLSHEINISTKLYKDYHEYKLSIFQSLLNENTIQDKVLLLKKTQKLLDRILFILFCEDRGLIEPNTLLKIIRENKELSDRSRDEPLYDTFKIYFGYIDKGNEKLKINGYNGGLFAPDLVLDSLIISDDSLREGAEKLSKYDFSTEVDVNILGHIFENSLNDIDELRAEANGEVYDTTKTKRKKDGIYYTPKYITKYIIDNTLGKICEEKKVELGLTNIDFDFSVEVNKRNKKQNILFDNIILYRTFLENIRILDPAVGSGAFLNQALEYLIEEHKFIDKYRRALDKDALGYFDISSSILENNLFGVDINEESVELARLSLWLRTAEKGRKLNDLSQNIIVGNSIISDHNIANDYAFNWGEKFPQIIKNGGFDIVIGNPPWGAELLPNEKEWLKENYPEIDSSTPNTFAYFIGLALRLKKKYLGLVLPDSIMVKDYANTRALLKKRLVEVYWYQNTGMPDEYQPFPVVEHDVCALLHGDKDSSQICYKTLCWINSRISEKVQILPKDEAIVEKLDYVFNAKLNNDLLSLQNRMLSKDTLDSLLVCHEGIHTGNARDLLFIKEKKRGDEKDLFVGAKSGDIIDNFYAKRAGWFVDYRKDVIDKAKGLYASLRDEQIFSLPKIYITRTGNPFYVFVDEKTYASNNFFSMQFKDLNINTVENLSIIACILLSKFSQFYIRNIVIPRMGGTFVETKIIHLLKLPYVDSILSDLELKKDFMHLADRLTDCKDKYYFSRDTFINRIVGNYHIQSVNEKIYNCFSASLNELVDELKKQKTKLSLVQQDELEGYFMQYKNIINSITDEIKNIEDEINRKVFDLYNLNAKEISLISNV